MRRSATPRVNPLLKDMIDLELRVGMKLSTGFFSTSLLLRWTWYDDESFASRRQRWSSVAELPVHLLTDEQDTRERLDSLITYQLKQFENRGWVIPRDFRCWLPAST